MPPRQSISHRLSPQRILTRLLATAALVLLAGCATTEPAPLQISAPTRTLKPGEQVLLTFCAMGDVPYKEGESELLARQLTQMPADIRFVFHVGDIQPGPKVPVTEEPYLRVSGILKKSPKPLFIIPGDNEFNDAPNVAEAWAWWNKHFLKFDEHWSSGLAVRRQGERPENLAFTESGILFVGINLVGGRIHDAAEWRLRHAQDAAWVKSNLEQQQAGVRAAVIFAQANPTRDHADFMTGFNASARAFAKPVLFLHGDGHKWIIDRPYEAKNILRVQVDMGGIAPPLKVTVTSDDADPFIFDRRMKPGTQGASTLD